MSNINNDNKTIANSETGVVAEDNMVDVKAENVKPEQPKKTYTQKNSYKSQECNVLWYDKKNNKLAVSFNGYGIYVNNVNNPVGDTVVVKYKGEIGKSNFEYLL